MNVSLNTKDIDKARLFQVLYNEARNVKPYVKKALISFKEAKNILDNSSSKYFKEFRGKVLDVNFNGQIICLHNYIKANSFENLVKVSVELEKQYC